MGVEAFRFVPAIEADALTAGDWRIAGTAPAETKTIRARAAKSRASALLATEPASFEEECDRARRVVSLAREAVDQAFSDIRFGKRLRTTSLKPAVLAIAASIARNPIALPSVTRMREVHEYTYMHSVSVCGLMIGLASELGLAPDVTEQIGLAGMLHDVGKATVPVELLDKPGPLDLNEYAVVQEHTTRGYELLRVSNIDSDIVLDVCLHHHERVDGTGYPSGISAESLSIFARMAAVCDVYDAVTSTRPYKRTWSPGEAIEWMGETEGQFDRRVLRAFRAMLGVFPVGSLVRLQSNRLGVVLNAPVEDPFAPDVAVFFCGDSRREIGPVHIATREDPIIGVEKAADWRLQEWPVRREQLLQQFASQG